jgi:hypothetical protein
LHTGMTTDTSSTGAGAMGLEEVKVRTLLGGR